MITCTMQNAYAALGATFLISVIPNVLLFFIPDWVVENDGKAKGIKITKSMLSFASGGLLGDVFLHSIPDLLIGEGHHGHHHDHKEDEGRALMVCLNILVGFFVFFSLERMMTLHAKVNGGDRGRVTAPSKKRTRSASAGRKMSKTKKGENDGIVGWVVGEVRSTYQAMKFNLSMTGYLNLAADSMHNFTDGLAIGASFAGSQSYGLGVAAFLAVMFHEIPHEIGDFTILVKSGLTKSEAIRAQFVTAISAFAGTVASLVGANSSETVKFLLLAWTTGGFLYIATVSMIPTILETDGEENAVKQSIFDAAAFILGVSMMLMVMQLE